MGGMKYGSNVLPNFTNNGDGSPQTYSEVGAGRRDSRRHTAMHSLQRVQVDEGEKHVPLNENHRRSFGSRTRVAIVEPAFSSPSKSISLRSFGIGRAGAGGRRKVIFEQLAL